MMVVAEAQLYSIRDATSGVVALSDRYRLQHLQYRNRTPKLHWHTVETQIFDLRCSEKTEKFTVCECLLNYVERDASPLAS